MTWVVLAVMGSDFCAPDLSFVRFFSFFELQIRQDGPLKPRSLRRLSVVEGWKQFIGNLTDSIYTGPKMFCSSNWSMVFCCRSQSGSNSTVSGWRKGEAWP